MPGGSIVFDFDTSQQRSFHLPLVAGTAMASAPQVSAEAGTVTPLVYLYGYLAVKE